MASVSKVYILGAGCSVAYGYPLGNGFRDQLEAFRDSLKSPETQRIKQAVSGTIDLLKARGIPTLDELVARINNGVFDDASQPILEVERVRDDRIHDAKVATCSLFRSLEVNALQSGLKGYSQLLWEIFPGQDHWATQLLRTSCRVLTFNYDRLFEMAFQNRFHPDTGQFAFYGSGLLNSGLNMVQKEFAGIEPGKFCFLKLHGSVEISVRDEHGEPSHYYDGNGPVSPQSRSIVDTDFFPRWGKTPNEHKPEPLIIFPHEKDYVRSDNQNAFPYRKYVNKVWEYAEKVVKEASEIWVVGYSFAQIDRPSTLKLLASAGCQKIVVQNPQAKEICDSLNRKHPELQLPLDPYESNF